WRLVKIAQSGYGESLAVLSTSEQFCTDSTTPDPYKQVHMATNSTLLCIHRDPGQLGLLKEHGYELATATNGSEGLRLFRSRPVDAVVLEHHLCLVDGGSIADQIKQARPDVPVVMLADHMELPAHALQSVDALVVESDGPHFLLATVHFILNVKPAQHREAKQRSETPRSPLRSGDEGKIARWPG